MNNQPPVTAIAYPVGMSSDMKSPGLMDPTQDSSFFLEHSTYATDSIETSGNFFTQLDSMIAAVKVESSALDAMRDKLKEVDNLRNQISAFNKRLIDADQANLSLKSALMKAQEAYSELHKQKADVESTSVSLRQELTRAKDLLGKEKSARQAAQQEIVQLREQLGRFEAMRENYERELKSIPALQESNDILKNDLASLRRKYKDDKAQLTRQVKHYETQYTNVEAIKAEVRGLAMRLLDVSNGQFAAGNAAPAAAAAAPTGGFRLPQQGQGGYVRGSASVASAVEFDADEDDDYDDDDGFGGGLGGGDDDSVYNNGFEVDEVDSFLGQSGDSLHHLGAGQGIPPPSFNSNAGGAAGGGKVRAHRAQQQQQQQPQQFMQQQQQSHQQHGTGEVKRRKKKQQPQQLQQQQSASSLSLPRII